MQEQEISAPQLFWCPYDSCFEKKVTYEKRDDLCQHIESNHKNKLQSDHRCNICDYITQSIGDIIIHKQKNHICQWCKYSTAKNYEALSEHVTIKHTCDECGAYVNSISLHKKSIHKPKIKNDFCSTCGAYVDNIRSHNKTYHSCPIS